MSLISKIKTWLTTKKLTKIIAPLNKIHQELDAFVEHAEKEVEKNFKKIEDLHILNSLKSEEKLLALRVKENINALLGRDTIVTKTAP